jgi:Periplasmic lysozyme inhibitor of I-type lysozyme
MSPQTAAPGVTGSEAPAEGFSRTLALQGITFRVSCPNRGSINELRIEPEGLLTDNSPMVQDVDGTVIGAEVADLNADGSPEIYVYVQSAGSGSYGSLVAFSANHLKSLSGIYLPPVAENREASKGYLGHDEFAVAENRLVQRFPLYRDIDTNATPTGGRRQVSYRLDAGEAGWLLRADRIEDQ